MLSFEERKQIYPVLEKKPLRIKMYLSTPLVFPQENIHLDALLTNIVAEECFGYDVDRWQNQDKQTVIPLPLEKTKGKHPVWKASVAFSSPLNKEYQDIWVKQTYDEFSGFISNKIVWPAGIIGPEVSKSLLKEVTLEKPTGPSNSSASGGFKSYFEHRNLFVTDYLIFHAVGNKSEVFRLLNKLKAVGKKTAIGFGQVKVIIIEEVKKDYSLFTPNKKPARFLPVEDFLAFQIKARMIAAPILPPYWSKRNLILQYTPTSPIPIWEWEEKSAQLFFEDSWFDEEMQEFREDNWFDD